MKQEDIIFNETKESDEELKIHADYVFNELKFFNGIIPIIKTDIPTSMIAYLQPEVQKPSGDWYGEEIQLMPKTIAVGLESHRATLDIHVAQLTDLSSLNIDKNQLFISKLFETLINDITKNGINKIKESANPNLYKIKDTFFIKIKKIIKKFIYKLFNIKYDNCIKIKSIDSLNTLLRNISNVIAYSSRISPANYIICSPYIATYIQDIKAFTFFNNNNVIRNSQYVTIGEIHNMKVIIDYTCDWMDSTIYVGRAAKTHEPGIYMIADKNIIRSISCISTEKNAPRLCAESRYTFINIPGVENTIAKLNLKINKNIQI